MFWNGDAVTQDMTDRLAERVAASGAYLRNYIYSRLGTQGSVVPFVASSPDEYPYRWGPELQDSITYAVGNGPLQAVVSSDAVDEHLDVGHHFSGDEEFGHFWNGWAYDFETGKIVKVASPHDVAPRPFLRRGLTETQSAIFNILAGVSQ